MRLLLIGIGLLLGNMAYTQQLTCEDEFLVTGSATIIGECIQLTSNANGQQGCTWFHEETDFSQPFTHTMTASFGNNDAGADGICLIYQSNSSSTCGISGGGIGALGIPNSFIVEFDTWFNGEYADIANDHAAVNVNGNFAAPINGPVSLGNIEDGGFHAITFSWDPATNTYIVAFDGATVLSGVYDIINNCFGGSPLAYWGYSSSTGGATNTHIICPGLPPVVNANAGPTLEIPCNGATITLQGGASDAGPAFTYEWTTFDGNIVSGENTPTPTVDQPGTYTLTVYNNLTLCESMDEVTVTLGELVAMLDEPPFLGCDPGEVVLNGLSSSVGSNITYQWSTPDGNIVSSNGTTATVDAPGEYTLTVLYDNGACSEEATVTVIEDPDVPFAFAQDEELLCNPPSVELDGTGSSEGFTYGYEWTTPDGIILAGEQGLFPVVGAVGAYTLRVTNLFSGCFDSYLVYVTANQNIPDAIAEVDGDLGCGGSSLVIDGSSSSFGPQYTYSWTTTNGSILSGASEPSPTVGQPGNYTLVVTDTENGCFDQTTVTVTGGTSTANAQIAPPLALTCSRTSIVLDGSGSLPITGASYEWTTLDGSIVGDAGQPLITVSVAGTYTLTVVDPSNNCTSSTSVTVTQNNTPPVAEAGTATSFGCDDTSQTLNGTGSSVANAQYTWTTTDGILLSGANTLMPVVGGAGTYTLLVTNTTNGCTAMDQVTVTADANLPTVQIAAPMPLDCATSSVVLDATGSEAGANFVRTWTTLNGQFIGGQDGLQPTVNAPGSYVLQISNPANGCTNSATVTVSQDTLRPVVDIPTAGMLNCAVRTLPLTANVSNSPNALYQWSTPNGQLQGRTDTLLAQAVAAGTYTLTVLNPNNQCQATAQVVVSDDTTAPDLGILPVDTLNCVQTTVTLQGALGSPVANASYQWSTSNGSITGGGNQPTLSVDAPGEYILTVVNPANGCSATRSIAVARNTNLPVADAGLDDVLDCVQTTTVIGGNGSTTGSNIRYQWARIDGVLTGNTTMPSLTTTLAGTFVLEVLDLGNGCLDTDTVTVVENRAFPMAVIATPGLLTCTDTLSLLDGSASTGAATLGYQWLTANGSLVGNTTAAQLFAAQAGIYQLIVTRPDNGCRDTTSVQVAQDDNFPTATIAPPLALTCTRTSVTLQGTAQSASGNVRIAWTTADGNIANGANGLQPTVTTAGTYQLQVTDEQSNCQTRVEVQVVWDTIAPVAHAGPQPVMNCYQPMPVLDGSLSEQANFITHAWTTSDGNILGGSSSLTATANAAGTYTLTATNTLNGCTDVATTTVHVDTLHPQIQWLAADVLTCRDTVVNLQAVVTQAGQMPNYQWTNAMGDSLPNMNAATLSVTTAGTYQLRVQQVENGCVQTASIAVTEDKTLPVPAILPADTLTCATTMIALSATSTGQDVQYFWDTTGGNILADATSASPTVNAPGTYTLTVTDAVNGCTGRTSVAVFANTVAPVVDIMEPLVIDCNYPTVTLTADVREGGTASQTYRWTTDDGTWLGASDEAALEVSAPGTYQILVSRLDNGCTGAASVLVTENTAVPVIVLAPLDVLDCQTLSVVADASGSVVPGNPAFRWFNRSDNVSIPGDVASISITAPGDYELTLTDIDNGCTDVRLFTVVQDTLLPTIVIDAPARLDCGTPQVVLSAAVATDGAPFTLLWTTLGGQIDAGATTPTPTVSRPGEYFVQAINTVNGCTQMATVEVMQDEDLPTVNIAPPALLTCAVRTTLLDAVTSSTGDEYRYTWTTNGGQFLQDTDGLTPLIGAPGSYTLTILNTLNGCSQQATVIVAQDIAPPTARAGNAGELDCTTGNIVLDGSGSSVGAAFLYAWSGDAGQVLEGSMTLNPIATQTGTYTLVVTNIDNGCVSTDRVTVTQDVPRATVSVAHPNCFGDAGTLFVTSVVGGASPYTYSVNGGVSSQLQGLFPGLLAGQYAIRVEDSQGCRFDTLINVVQPDSLFVIALEPEQTIPYGDSINLLVQTNYDEADLSSIRWEGDASLRCTDCLLPVAQPESTTLYRITVRTENGCSDDALIRVFVKRDFPVYIPTAFSPDGDGTNDRFYIFTRPGTIAQVRSLQVFDRWGNSVFSDAAFPANDPTYGWDGTHRGTLMNPAVFVYVAEIELVDGRVEVFQGEVVLMR